jgi:predicted nucleic-acid-binding Zn-ribbon protein
MISQVGKGFWFLIEVFGQSQPGKYLMKCCFNFRTCPHKHTHTHTHTHNCGYTTFYPKILSVWNTCVLAQIAFVASLSANKWIHVHIYIFFFSWRDNPLVGLGLLIHEVYLS